MSNLLWGNSLDHAHFGPRGNYVEVDAINCTVAMDCMEDNLSQSGVAGSARDNPITIDDDSECESLVKISKTAEYYR